MPRGGRDGVMRRSPDGVLSRLMHVRGEAVIVRAWPRSGSVRICAEAPSPETAATAVERMRFALGTDHDLGLFLQAFRRDRLLGPIMRRKPWLRPFRRPEPFEALAWAVSEQLIDAGRAADIQRGLVARHGPRSSCGTLRDVPCAHVVARLSPAEVERCGMSPKRAITLVRAAREVASGRADLSTHEPAWRRLRTVSGIGPWTVECLAYHGQGRDDQIPAGDLSYIKLVGRLAGLGRRATEDEVREFFAAYAPFAGLAGTYLVHGAYTGAWGFGSRSFSRP
jgi:3-methyladenine DNA glycosylase/8-oxoguanine DNA glycosylase